MSRSEPVSVMPEGSMESFRSGSLEVQVYRSRPEMAAAAAAAVAGEIRRLIGDQRRAVGIFAATPSIAEFYDRLVEAPGLEWTSVIGFHLGEHLGREESAPDSSRRFLIERLVKRVPLAEFHGVRGEAANPQAVCANYAALLRSRPPDWAVLEIGRDGSLAYLPPALCDFDDPEMVRLVEA
ncbi:MAG TPA: 6-phosphogluconolactonase, partial [Blastocatellia bacterium]|nr:6-phosphogluconolactonase [Blastocatellia bacterium]